MKMNILLSLIIFLFFENFLHAQIPPNDKNWQVNFIDEFNSINYTRWSIADNDDHGGEPQVYLKISF